MERPLEYNRIAIQNYRTQLAARRASLPTLKSKESVLRLAVQGLKDSLVTLERETAALAEKINNDVELWAEFPYNIFSLEKVHTRPSRIAGVTVPEYDRIQWREREFSRFNKPGWLSTGIGMLRDLANLTARLEIGREQLRILEDARRKTTRKVNLYEKVQIPHFLAAIAGIKRHLEDVDNLEKAAMKIVRQRLAARKSPVEGGNHD